MRGLYPTALDVIGAGEAGMMRRFAPSRFSTGFLLEESLRLFNFGTSLLPSYYVTKTAKPLTGPTFEAAVTELGETFGALAYLQLETLLNLGSQALRRLVGVQDPFVDLAISDWYLRSWILPKLFFDRRWVSPVAAKHLPDIRALAETFGSVTRELTRMSSLRFLKVVEGRDPGTGMLTAEWIGSPYCLVGASAGQSGAGFLTSYARSDQGGLAEKIHATLCLMGGRGLDRGMSVDADRGLHDWIESTRQSAWRVARELARLGDGHFAARLERTPQLLRWLDDIEALEEPLLAALSRWREVPLPVSASERADAVRSDLAWGLILTSYLRLYLVRALLLAFVAAFPFAAIHHGGKLRRPNSDRRYDVPGIIGPLGVALWEAFGGDSHSSCFHASAWDGAAPLSGFRDTSAGERVDPASPLAPGSNLLTGPPRGPHFDDTYALELDQGIERDTRRVNGAVRLVNARDASAQKSDTPTVLQRLAHEHHGHPPMEEPMIAAGVSPTPRRLLAVNSRGGTSPQVERLPVPFAALVAENPPYLDRFFDLTCFNKWTTTAAVEGDKGSKETVVFGRSSLIFGAPLTAQLQTYVAGRMFARAFCESRAAGKFAELTDEIKFTCASIQWGGKFPPHVTHRDGFGFDWSVQGSATKPLSWHWSTHWPRDNQTLGEGNEKRTYAKELLGLADEHSELARTLRIVLGGLEKPLSGRRSDAEKRAANVERRAIVERVLSKVLESVPAELLHKPRRVSDIPCDVIVARPASGKPCRPVHRELLTKRLAQVFNQVDGLYHKSPDLDPAAAEQCFDELDLRLAGLPEFHDGDSHELHHLAHACVVLSAPGEIVWGAPIYHLHALRAIYFALRDHPWNPFVSREPGARRTPSIPLPRFHFLPHDHHHHWHVQYWGDVTVSRMKSATGSSVEISDHASFVRACLPLWMMLGVELEPFLGYLDDYASKLGKLPPNRSSERVLASIELLREDLARAAMDYPIDADAAAALWKDLVDRLRSSGTRQTADRWPPEQSIIAEIVESSEAVLRRVRQYHDDYVDNGVFDGSRPELQELEEATKEAIEHAGESDAEFIREKLVHDQAPDEATAHDTDAREHEGISVIPDERGGQLTSAGE